MDDALGYESRILSYVTINTLEGEMTANIGDWIIEGIKNELYPCKHDIFVATYDKVADA